MPRKASTESPTFLKLAIQVEADDLEELKAWAQAMYRTPGGQASYLLKELLTRRRNGNGQEPAKLVS